MAKQLNQDPNGTAYDLTGPVGAPVVALIHGLGLCKEMWSPMLPDFAAFRVLTYDLYGHGQSAPPPTTATLKVYADQLGWLMDDLEIPKAHIIGFSIGGMINRRFALDYPDETASLVILNSPHDRGDKAQAEVEERAKMVRNQGALSTMDGALKRWFSPDYLEHGTGVQLVKDWRAQVDPESYAQAAWVLANGVRELIRPTLPITAPTLVMTSQNDSGSTPQMSHTIASEILGAEIYIAPKLQHLGLMETPKIFTNPILDFLNKSEK